MRGWEDYKVGFGDFDREFWLGKWKWLTFFSPSPWRVSLQFFTQSPSNFLNELIIYPKALIPSSVLALETKFILLTHMGCTEKKFLSFISFLLCCWIKGNILIWALTNVDNETKYELAVDLEDWSSNRRFARYRSFRLGSERDSFRWV